MMTTQVTLDKMIVDKATVYAAQKGESLSLIIEKPTEGGAPRLSPCREILILRVKTSNRGCSRNATMSLFNHVFCIS